MSARTFAVTMGVLAVLALLGFGLIAKGDDSLAVGQSAPDREHDVLGEETTGAISDYRGKWVLVNFWASWCDPCRAEAPELQAFYERHKADLVVLGIATEDLTGDSLEFVEEFGLTYPQLRDQDPDQSKEDFAMTGLPENFLIDPTGKVALIRRGPVDEAYLEDYVAPLIGGAPASDAPAK